MGSWTKILTYILKWVKWALREYSVKEHGQGLGQSPYSTGMLSSQKVLDVTEVIY